MWQKFKEYIFGKPPIEKYHELFGKMLFMGGHEPSEGDYWESEIAIEETKEPLSVLINAPISGSSSSHVNFYQDAVSDLDELFNRCWPIFEPDFEQWTHKKFTGNWKDDFEIMSIEIPKNADVNNEWTVCYYVDAANHYFTARFINGKPKFNEIEG